MSPAVQNQLVMEAAELSALKRKVTLNSMAAAALMTVLKLAAGLMSGSLGVLSDAAHSALDLVGVTLTFFSVRVSDRPADEGHTYGHAKFENLSAFAETGLMAVSCAWIIWEAMQRMFTHTLTLHHSLWPVLVLLMSIAVDWWRSRRLQRVAEQTGNLPAVLLLPLDAPDLDPGPQVLGVEVFKNRRLDQVHGVVTREQLQLLVAVLV